MVVVSEETGQVSFASDGQICTVKDMAQLRSLLSDDTRPEEETKKKAK